MKKPMINENRLFSLIPHFFEKPESILMEIAQNAQRSGATRLDLHIHDNQLYAIDNGTGTMDPSALVILADSAWDAEVEENQMPAGWGLFFLYSICEEVTFRTLFGALHIQCEAFLNDEAYREDVLNYIDPQFKSKEGFEILATLKPGMAEKLLDKTHTLTYFPLDIQVNAKRLTKKRASDIICSPLETTYQGNPVYIRLTETFPTSAESLAGCLYTIWYGIQIANQPFAYHNDVVIDVRQGLPLTPVLPYRQDVKQDQKLADFYEFVRKTVVDYCILVINGEGEGKEPPMSCMRIMGRIATQDELDALNYFYVTEEEPYSDGGDYIVVKKGAPVLTSEYLSWITLTYESGMREDISAEVLESMEKRLFLPSGTIKTLNLPSNQPSWLTVDTKEYQLEVQCEGEVFNGEAAAWWKMSSAKCGDKEIKCLGLVDDYSEATFFYTEGPNDMYEIVSYLFEQALFYEDGDTYDSQQADFNERMDRDIAKILKKFHLSDLLKGLRLLGVDPIQVKQITVSGKKLVVNMKRKRTTEVFALV